MKKSGRNKDTWIKNRHSVVWTLLVPVFHVYCCIKYGARVQSFSEYDRAHLLAEDRAIAGKPCIILYNHVTAFDQFFVALSCRTPVYFVATEDIFSMGILSKIIKYLVAPIPIKKHSTDVNALKSIFKVAKEGGIIAIAPEGNRTYSGKTCSMKDTISSLCRKLRLPIVMLKIDGGYGVDPRWGHRLRKGTVTCSVEKVLYPDEISTMDSSELINNIKTALYNNEAKDSSSFTGRRRAEYIERAIYVCPECNDFSRLESNGNYVSCPKCGLKLLYGTNTVLECVNRPFSLKYVSDLYDFQENFINSIDTRTLTSSPVFTDTAALYRVIPYKHKELINNKSEIKLYGDRITVNDITFSYEDITGIACMGRNKLNIETKDKLYQIKGNKRFNALKYVNFYYRYNNLTKEVENDKFLGL